jgi:hypothetical protein
MMFSGTLMVLRNSVEDLNESCGQIEVQTSNCADQSSELATPLLDSWLRGRHDDWFRGNRELFFGGGTL